MHSTLFLSRNQWVQNFLGDHSSTRLPALARAPCPCSAFIFGNCTACLSMKSFKKIPFWPSSDATPHFEHHFSTTHQMLLVPINLRNNFSFLTRVLDFKAVLHCKQGCAAVFQRSRGRMRSRWPCWAGLACWEASPRAQLVSQPQVQASLSFWKRSVASPAVSDYFYTKISN